MNTALPESSLPYTYFKSILDASKPRLAMENLPMPININIKYKSVALQQEGVIIADHYEQNRYTLNINTYDIQIV